MQTLMLLVQHQVWIQLPKQEPAWLPRVKTKKEKKKVKSAGASHLYINKAYLRHVNRET